MIINVPNHTELEEVSLRLLFKAWAEIVTIITDWDTVADLRTADHSLTIFGEKMDPHPEEETLKEIESDRKQYLKAAQNDLQSIYTLIQQSQEIGLKALICEISPYLLLKKKTAAAVDRGTSTFDFLDMSTHDAAELPDIHDTFRDKKLSKGFRDSYDVIRRNRNKIYHLGAYKSEINPTELIDTIIDQYTELYHTRHWWRDRIRFETNRLSAFYDSRDWTELTNILRETSRIDRHLSERQFRFLMKNGRDTPRFICYSCVSSADLDNWDINPSDFPTAYRIAEDMLVRCVVCEDITEMSQEQCADSECGCGFQSEHPDAPGRCMQCGCTQLDIKERSDRTNRHMRK